MAATPRELNHPDRPRIPEPEHDHRDADEIRRDIQRNRREMDVLADALEHKLSARTLADEVWNGIKDRFGDGGAALGEQVREHPVPLALIAAGLGWYAIESWAGPRMRAREASGEPGLGDRMRQVKDRARTRAADLRASGERATERVRQSYEDNPLAMGAVALGLGLAAGLLAPRTRVEDEWLGQTREEMLARAAEAGADLAESARPTEEPTD